MNTAAQQVAMYEYYNRRAPVYEESMYADIPSAPERGQELAHIASDLQRLFAKRRVLEVACGTGYWTRIVAQIVECCVATDVTPQTLALARSKDLPPGKVDFQVADAFALDGVPGSFDAELANFWLSHVPKSRLDFFLEQFHRKLGCRALVFMADNARVGISRQAPHSKPGSSDTYQFRKLPDGTEFEIVKNHYSKEQLQALLEPRSRDLQISMGEYFWWAQYTVKDG